MFGGDFDSLLIGIEEFRSVSEFGFFQPCVFFGSVTFPSDKVGSVFRGATMFEYPFYFIFFFIIDEIQGWSWEVRSVNFILVIGGEEWGVENRVNFP